MKNKYAILLLLIPSLYYLLAALFQINQPGFYYDEAFQLLPAINFTEDKANYYYDCALFLEKGTDSSPFKFGRRDSYSSRTDINSTENTIIPLMLRDQLGTLKTYLFLLIFKLFSIAPTTVRLTTVILGLLSLWLTCLWTNRLFNPPVAFISTLLLALDPNFIFYMRTDFGPIAIMMVLKMAALVGLLFWWRTGKSSAFIISLFCLGLGAFDKANFLWFAAALVISGILLKGREVWRRLRPGMLISGIVILLIGAGPLILFNILNAGKTFLKVLDQDPRTQKSFIHVIENLSMTFTVFIQTLNGFWLEELVWLGHFPVPLFFLYLFAFSLIVITVLILRSRRTGKKNLSGAEFVLILFLGTLFFSMITPQTWGAHHMLMTYPFPHILCGIALVLIFSPPLFQKKKIKILAYASLFLFGLTVYTDCRLTLLLHQTFAAGKTGWWAWSNRINEVADYLVTEPDKTTLCLDWGLYRNLAVLTAGRAQMEELGQALNDATVPEIFKDYFPDPNYLYLLHPKNKTLFPGNLRSFKKALIKYDYTARRVKTFSDRSEEDLYILYEVKPN